MAFNPFHGFRKHQKVVFAALTIVCMLTFVLASGVGMAGDFFSELSRWLGGQRRSGTDVARLYASRKNPSARRPRKRPGRIVCASLSVTSTLRRGNGCGS